MSQRDIRINILKQKLSINNNDYTVTGTSGFYRINISYDEDWSNIARKVVIFKSHGIEGKTLALEDTGSIILPWELTQKTGEIEIGVVGYNEDETVVITTTSDGDNLLKVLTPSPCAKSFDEALEPSPDIWHLIQNDIANLKSQTSDIQTKINTIEEGAEVNVQSDWVQTDNSRDDFIKNKPTDLVQDANYTHTDNNFTDTNKNKLASIEAEANKTIVDDHLSSDSKNPVQNKVINTKFKGVDNDLSDIMQCLTTTTKGKVINLVGTTDVKIRDFKLFGDTSQARYSGKNLFNWQDPDYYLKGIIPNNDATAFIIGSTNINYKNKIITLKIPALPSTSYTISRTLRFKQILVYESAEEPAVGKPFTLLSRQSNIQSVTVTTKPTTNWLFAKFYNTYLPEDYEFNELASSMQVEQSVTATDYEKFVGELPSPNSEYPQNINTVTGDQTVVIRSKNLISDLVPATIDGVTFTPNDDGSILVNGTATKAIYYNLRFSNFTPNGKVALFGCPAGGSPNTYMIETKITAHNNKPEWHKDIGNGIVLDVKTIEHVGIVIRVGTTVNNLIFKPQLEYGDKATDFEKGQKRTYTIPLGDIELCKIGDYQDKIYYDDGWKLERNVTKLLLDGNIDYYGIPGGVYYIEKYNDYATKDNIPVCERLIGANNTRSADSARYFPDGTVACSDGHHANRIYIKLSKQNPSDIFSINPTKLYYGLKNPIISDITDIDLVAQLDAIKNSKAYKYTTNFTSTAEISVDTLLSANYLLSKTV